MTGQRARAGFHTLTAWSPPPSARAPQSGCWTHACETAQNQWHAKLFTSLPDDVRDPRIVPQPRRLVAEATADREARVPSGDHARLSTAAR